MDEVGLLVDMLTNTNAALGKTWSQATQDLVNEGKINASYLE